MSVRTKFLLVMSCGLTALGGLALTDCMVTGTAQARPGGTITVQPSATVSTGTVVAQPTYAQTTYAQPTYQQPVYQQPAQPVYAAPPPVGVGVGVGVGGAIGFQPVSQGWVTNGYAEGDFVSYNMSLRARQFAAGYVPITQLYRAVMGQGQTQSISVTATPGRCYRIIGVGGAGVRDLDLRLRDMNGNVIDQDVATDNFPVLGLQRPLCLNWTGTFQIEVIMYAGGGEFGVQAFASN